MAESSLLKEDESTQDLAAGQRTRDSVLGTFADGTSPLKFKRSFLGGLHDGCLECVVAEAEAVEQAETCVTPPEADELTESAPCPSALPTVRALSSASLNRQFILVISTTAVWNASVTGQESVKNSQVMKEPDSSTSVKQHHRSQTDLCRLMKVLMRHVAWSARGGGHPNTTMLMPFTRSTETHVYSAMFFSSPEKHCVSNRDAEVMAALCKITFAFAGSRNAAALPWTGAAPSSFLQPVV